MGTIESTRNLSLQLDTKRHWQNLSTITNLELWGLLKAYNFQGKTGTVNYVNFT